MAICNLRAAVNGVVALKILTCGLIVRLAKRTQNPAHHEFKINSNSICGY
jgi:hypothetical protein